MFNGRPIMFAVVSSAVVFTAAACSRGDAADNAAGSLDMSTAIVSTVGPGVHVTRTDAASVRDATQYKLTEENFAKFVHGADSLFALMGRDSSVRTHLTQPLADAASPELDAGVKWLESDTTVTNTLAAVGLSARDYFVMGIAIASAEQHLANPSSAPPTPAAKDNAEFLRGKSDQLARLRALETSKPGIAVTP